MIELLDINFHFILFLIVKYLKEVMPYFRKASILNEIGWDFSGGQFLQDQRSNGIMNISNDKYKNGFSSSTMNSSHSSSSSKTDTKIVPLLLCHLIRGCDKKMISNYQIDDSMINTIIEIHSPNRQQKCVLRSPDSSQCSAWFSAIHSAICSLMIHAVQESNDILKEFLDGALLKHMGWLFEKVKLKLIMS